MNSLDLRKAIWDNFIDGLKAWYEEVPISQLLPYTVWQFLSVVPEDTFTEDLDDIDIQFNVFSNSSVECDQIGKRIEDHFENTTFLINEIEMKFCLTLHLPAFKSGDVWQSTLSFQGYL